MTITPAGHMETIVLGPLTIDPERFRVMHNGAPVVLTKTEFLILYLMMQARGKVQSRTDIARFAWGSAALDNPRTIDTHISNIRRKVGKVQQRDIIRVIKGVGYKLDDALTA